MRRESQGDDSLCQRPRGGTLWGCGQEGDGIGPVAVQHHGEGFRDREFWWLTSIRGYKVFRSEDADHGVVEEEN